MNASISKLGRSLLLTILACDPEKLSFEVRLRSQTVPQGIRPP